MHRQRLSRQQKEDAAPPRRDDRRAAELAFLPFLIPSASVDRAAPHRNGHGIGAITRRRQMRKMIILRGNSAAAGHIDPKTKEFVGYVAEDGVTYPAWPVGALHVAPSKAFAIRIRFVPTVPDIHDQPHYDPL